jgi:hypothetical protein
MANRTRTLVTAGVGTIAVVAVATFVILANDEPPAVEGATTTTSTVVASTTATGDTATTVDIGFPLEAWVGTYSWIEFVEGDPGSDQTLAHELELTDVSEDGLTMVGTLSQEGFQTSQTVTVLAVSGDESISIEFVSPISGNPPYVEAEVLFRMSGDPADPQTTIVGLSTLVPRPEPGTYFLPGPARAPVASAPMPTTIWGVELETFDLVQVDIETGEELNRVTGWGVDAATQTEGGGQVLQTVEVGADGRIWVDDCCEPAFGNTFGIVPGVTADIQDAPVRVTGVGPVVSPDGRLVAIAIGDLGITILEADTGSEVVDPSKILGLLAGPGGDTLDGFIFPHPLTWVDGDTIAIIVDSVTRSAINLVDISDPLSPVLVGEPITIEGVAFDGGLRSDGQIAALVDVPEQGGKQLVFVDPATRAESERVDLPGDTVGIDYDASGTHLLIVGGDFMLQVFGKAGFEQPLGPFVDAGW